MRIITILFLTLFSFQVWAGKNVEITAKYVKDNDNYIYMESAKEKFKIIKKELTKEGVKQILANKETSLTLFIPEKSLKYRKAKEPNSH